MFGIRLRGAGSLHRAFQVAHFREDFLQGTVLDGGQKLALFLLQIRLAVDRFLGRVLPDIAREFNALSGEECKDTPRPDNPVCEDLRRRLRTWRGPFLWPPCAWSLAR
jgi:hypothetical protein